MTAKKENTWEGLLEAYQEKGSQRLWRTHSDAVNKALVIRWLSSGQTEILLKTDLFDEAVGDGLSLLLNSLAKRVFYIDTSLGVHQMAQCRHSNLQTIGADVRCLPFSHATFDGIISNSTLDHFETHDEILTSLRELYRVLRPGGQMILTLDNLANPIILLRNRLPFHLLYRMKIVPYYVGLSLSPHRLQHLLKEVGFKVLEVDAIMHCPRVLAVAMAHCLEKYTSAQMQRCFLRFLKAFEGLSRLPTRFLTGHFIAVRAMRR